MRTPGATPGETRCGQRGSAYHVLVSTRFYIEDTEDVTFKSGKPFTGNWLECDEEDLPSQADILDAINLFTMKTERWLSELDYETPNETFPWAGKTQLSVAIFLLRHSLYHLGELSALLNESKNGDVPDHYVLANEEK